MTELNEIVLEARLLRKAYFNGVNAFALFEDVDLSLKRGESLCIFGESGSGKSTLLNILSGLEKLDSGTLSWNGVAVEKYSLDALAEKRRAFIGFIFQSFHLINEFTVFQNLFLASRIAAKSTPSAIKGKIVHLLEKVALLDKLNVPVKVLSGGERQRVAIVRSLLNDPDIIFADEPTGNLDHETSCLIFDVLLRISTEENKSLIFVTHDNSFKNAFSRTLTLRNKKLVS